MTAFSAIDLEKLPPPEVVEPLDFESIVSAMLEDFQQRWPDYSETLESDPAIKLIEVAAYRELLLRARINDAAKAVMLAFARNSDLEHIAAPFDVYREVVDPGDPDATPPIAPTYEDDERLRLRAQLSFEGHTTAGPIGSYIFHTLASNPLVKDVDVQSPAPGEVVVTILSFEGNGLPSASILQDVLLYLNSEDIRPLTDHVVVNPAEIIPYSIEARLHLLEGPDSEVVRQAAETALKNYVDSRQRLGADIAISGIYAALHQPGVQEVELISPLSNIVIQSHQAGWNISIEISVA